MDLTWTKTLPPKFRWSEYVQNFDQAFYQRLIEEVRSTMGLEPGFDGLKFTHPWVSGCVEGGGYFATGI